MLKKLKIFLGAACLILLCAGLAACKPKDKLGAFDVLVYYDAGGTEGFFGNPQVEIVDGFNFSKFQPDENGDYHFKLLDPMDDARPGDITLSREGSFCVGWYKTRTAKTDDEGNLLDEQDRVLVEVDGVYYVKGTENAEEKERITSKPHYTYSDRWDFDNDELVCNPDDGVKELRLYAGWVSDFTFEYYYKDGENWRNFGTTKCNLTSLGDLATDKIVAYLPQWSDGKMEHTRSYEYDTTRQYTFPSRSGYTFKAAYLDEACTQPVEDGKVTHTGSINYDNALPVNDVCRIYVDFDEGVRYKISTAEQLIDNASTSGYYEILNDLEFSANQYWPTAFVTGEFKGKFTAAEGNVKISGIKADFNGAVTTQYGGLFGKIGASAEIKGITFEGAKLYVNSTRPNEVSSLGLFAGEIDPAAKVEDVTAGGAIYLGQLAPTATISLNMLVGGDNKAGVACAEEGIELYVTGVNYVVGKDAVEFRYDVHTTTSVDAAGDVKIVYEKWNNPATEEDKNKTTQETYITIWKQS